MQKTYPVNAAKYFLYIFLILTFVVVPPVSAQDPQQQSNPTVNTEQEGSVSSHQIYLPFGSKQYNSGQHLWSSPFSISIAALHELFPADETLPVPASINAAFPSLLDALIASGATGTRVDLKWSEVQRSAPTGGPVTYYWAWYDRTLGLLSRAGMQILVSIETANDWAVDDPSVPCGPIKPGSMDDFNKFITALVTRYKEPPYNIKFWEIDNEPDSTYSKGADIGQGCWGNDGDRYAQMLKEAYQAIKAVDPLATVLMGGLAYDSFTEIGGVFVRTFPDTVMSAGGGNYYDIHNLHYFSDFRDVWEAWNTQAPTCGDITDEQGPSYYAGGIDIIAKANHYKNRMLVCHGVDKKLWFTEIGASIGRSDIPHQDIEWQARYIPQVYTRALSIGVENITWYGLTTPNDGDGVGLLYHDLSPKPSFYAYATLARELKGHEFHHTMSITGIEGYVFRNNLGVEKQVLWKDESSLQSYTGYSLSPATRVRIVDHLGAESYVLDGGAEDMDGTQNGSILLRITERPVYASVTQP